MILLFSVPAVQLPQKPFRVSPGLIVCQGLGNEPVLREAYFEGVVPRIEFPTGTGTQNNLFLPQSDALPAKGTVVNPTTIFPRMITAAFNRIKRQISGYWKYCITLVES